MDGLQEVVTTLFKLLELPHGHKLVTVAHREVYAGRVLVDQWVVLVVAVGPVGELGVLHSNVELVVLLHGRQLVFHLGHLLGPLCYASGGF